MESAMSLPVEEIIADMVNTEQVSDELEAEERPFTPRM